ncbi:unnamed protein product [Cyprideis torosa]|uniref:Uncharacterized protein n=1 Tax=Cyprideis torosa TaxID=163714 RepID=A0A7R8ZR19_9CRUS|nr:unnamed protein product [Cyprideis torosa]CAG0904196.1 unnamed protein product [Cyprideis torosa]
MSSYPLDHCDQEQNEFFPSLNLASVMEFPQTVFLSPSSLYRHLMFPATVAPTSVTWTLPPTTTFTHEVSSRQSLLFALTEQDEVQCASNMQDSTGNPQDSTDNPQDSTGNPQNTSSDTGPGLPNIGLVSQDTSRGSQQSSCELQDPHFAVQDTSGMEMHASMFGYVSRRSVSGVRGIVKSESELGIKQEVVGNCLSPQEAFPVVHQDICVEAGSSLEHEQQQQNRFEMKPEHPRSYFQLSSSSVEGRRQVPPKAVVVNYEDDLLETTLNQTVKIDVDDVEAEFLDFDFAAALRELDAFHPQSKKLSSVQDVEAPSFPSQGSASTTLGSSDDGRLTVTPRP